MMGLGRKKDFNLIKIIDNYMTTRRVRKSRKSRKRGGGMLMAKTPQDNMRNCQMYWGNNNCATNALKYDYPGALNMSRGVRRMNSYGQPYMTPDALVPKGMY